MLFAAGLKAGYYDPEKVQLDHMPFGMVMQMGPDGKPTKIKTREGKTIKLVELLDEAKKRAMETFKERLEQNENKVQVDESKLEETAEILGISAIKYYDLMRNRVPDYVFDFDEILRPLGNTGVYQLYAYVRIVSIIDKSKYG